MINNTDWSDTTDESDNDSFTNNFLLVNKGLTVYAFKPRFFRFNVVVLLVYLCVIY